jgi:hypothetical protein
MAENEQVINQEGGDGGEITVDPVVEKAKGMGWVPKEEFRGDPERWTEADKFVERGENILPIVKERLDHVIKENQELKASFKEFNDYHKKTAEREFNRAVQTLEQRKLEAVQDGNVTDYQQIELEQRELLKERPATVQPRNAAPPEFDQFTKENDWYTTDPEMKAYADNMGVFIANTKNLAYGDILKEVRKEVETRYPHKFQNQRRDAANSVERDTATGLPIKGGKGYNDLPTDARAACDKFVKTIPGFTKEQYLKDYFG